MQADDDAARQREEPGPEGPGLPWLAELDRCVKCGLCLPECPTYRLTADENESPRGRIALMEGLATGRIAPDRALRGHINNCLTCRRCERMCPSAVRYGALADHTRALLLRRPRGLLAPLIERPRVLSLGVRIAQRVPIAWSRPLGTALHRLHRVATALPANVPQPPPGLYPATGSRDRGATVALFTGCASGAQQGSALVAALRVLRHAGYRVRVPAGQGCCGAMAAHAGHAQRARRLAEINHDAFGRGLDAVISVATGCGIHLSECRPPLPAAHRDISDFLVHDGGLVGADFAPLHAPVLLHTPCSLENVYRGAEWPRRLLAPIPGLEVIPVGETGQCCGSAGDHMLRQPARAARLREPVLEAVARHPARILLTTNVGCALHLADGLRARGMNLEVLHPVELLMRQLHDAAGADGA